MELPSRLRIGPYTYIVEIMPISKSAKRNINGECDTQNMKIQIFEELPPDRSAEVLLHEVLHACFHAADLTDEDKEEKIITTMARQIAQVMRDNPHFVNWLTANLADDAK